MEMERNQSLPQLDSFFIPFNRLIHLEKYKQEHQGKKNQKRKYILEKQPSPSTCPT